MRVRNQSGGVTLQAIAGNHGVFLGLDLAAAARPGCLGFAIHREDQTEGEQYWLAGFKTFRSVVPVPDAKQIYSSWDHPVQSFYWGDYSAKPAHDYVYRVVPRYGTAKNLVSKPAVEATVAVRTNDPDVGTHGVYFNRGVAASQAYSRQFGATPDNLAEPLRTKAMAWLSRGLDEALLAFIAQGAAPGKALRVAAYEFSEPNVLAAFQAARDAGGDVQIVYHAKDDDTGNANENAIAASQIDRTMLTQRLLPQLAHNKFVVLCRVAANGNLTPQSVWTGSTNMSEGGIFGHSNVGHAVRDAGVAVSYLDYWEQVALDPPVADLRTWVAANSAFDPTDLQSPGVHTLFSPRSGLAVLRWYAAQFTNPQQAAHITLPFGLTGELETPLEAYGGGGLHFVLLNKKDDHQDQWSTAPGVLLAVGAKGGPNSLARWSRETLTGFNPRVPYLHTKIILIDPLSADPTVITGSANFSPASTSGNDENMLIIRGDTDVADVYFAEYARMFQHFYARYWANQITADPHGDDHNFLGEDASWQDPYFTAGSIKQSQRLLFSSGVAGNA